MDSTTRTNVFQRGSSAFADAARGAGERPAASGPAVTSDIFLKSPVEGEQPGAFTGEFNEITDWIISVTEPESRTVIYPGPHAVPAKFKAHLLGMHQQLLDKYEAKDGGTAVTDYRYEFNGEIFRGHRQMTVEGIVHYLRRFPGKLPDIRKLNIPEGVYGALCHKDFGARGGLILVVGESGMGKNTTCAAVIIERVKKHGSFCLTVEDPPEFMLQGRWPAANGKFGVIVQVPADRTRRPLSQDMRDSLRCYPSGMPGSMLFVGEIDCGDTADQVLRAANQGNLVISTLHATDPIAALERLIAMATSGSGGDTEARDTLARQIKAVVHQRIVNGQITVQALFSAGSDSPVANRIRNRTTAALSTDLAMQQHWIRNKEVIQKVIEVDR